MAIYGAQLSLELEERRNVPWFAVIGTRPVSSFELSDQQLTSAGPIDDLRLSPTARVAERHGSSALGSEIVRQASPIVIEGTCVNFHDWGLSAHEEGVEVRLLCALLSVAWNKAWEPKVSPAAGHPNQLIAPLGAVSAAEDSNLLPRSSPCTSKHG